MKNHIWNKKNKNKKQSFSLQIGKVLTGCMLLFVLIGFFYTPYDPNAMNGAQKLDGPSLIHLMGTDNFGRDILSRTMVGMKTTCFVAFSVTAIGAFFGTLIGAFTGYFGGWVDGIIMRFNDMLLAFPSILLALVFISVLGSGKNQVIFALGILFIPSFTRIIRGEFMLLKELDYVKSAKLAGASPLRIMFLHILPNTFPALLSAVTVGFNNAVLAEAGMSYLGIGVQPPDASLGRMLAEAQGYLSTAPWYALFPGIVTILLILGFSFLSEGIGEKN